MHRVLWVERCVTEGCFGHLLLQTRNTSKKNEVLAGWDMSPNPLPQPLPLPLLPDPTPTACPPRWGETRRTRKNRRHYGLRTAVALSTASCFPQMWWRPAEPDAHQPAPGAVQESEGLHVSEVDESDPRLQRGVSERRPAQPGGVRVPAGLGGPVLPQT